MNRKDLLSAVSGLLSRKLDFLLFAGLWLWLGIFQVSELKQDFWGAYFSALTLLSVVQIPGLLFAWYKPSFKQALDGRRYLLVWLACFAVFLPVITFCWIALLPEKYDAFFIIIAALSSVTLEVLLNADVYYRKRVQQISWIKKMKFENAVFISLVLIAVAISAMAVSSMGNPAYDSDKQLLIGFEFSPYKIIRHWLAFLSFTAQFLFIYLSGYLFFFINSRVLVSKILKQRGMLMYLLSVLVTVGFLYPIIGGLLTLLPINQVFGRDIFLSNPFALENAFGAMAIMLISLPVVLAIQWATQNGRIISLEKEKAQTELDLLKQQLNPHFFFNTLNNLYALSLQRSDKTPESILQLSELMRYVIYKGQEEKVPLTQEVKYIRDYVELQQMRLLKPLNFTFTEEGAGHDHTITPLLLIVLVENAFKHGIEPAENNATLNLHLRCTGNNLYFSCENSVEVTVVGNKGGIGLANLTRRLDLLYPGKYSLKMAAQNNTFKAELQLLLK